MSDSDATLRGSNGTVMRDSQVQGDATLRGSNGTAMRDSDATLGGSNGTAMRDSQVQANHRESTVRNGNWPRQYPPTLP